MVVFTHIRCALSDHTGTHLDGRSPEPERAKRSDFGTFARCRATSGAVTEQDDPGGQGRERRRFTRVALDAHVRVNVLSTDTLFESRIRDLSENGVFILTSSTRPVGTGIQLAIVVRQGEMEVRARGVIVHEVKADDADDARPAGIGVMFTEVENGTVADLKRLLDDGIPLL